MQVMVEDTGAAHVTYYRRYSAKIQPTPVRFGYVPARVRFYIPSRATHFLFHHCPHLTPKRPSRTIPSLNLSSPSTILLYTLPIT